MKKFNKMLNIIMGAYTGAYLGRGLFIVWNYKPHPEVYAAQSAPWYTAIWVEGLMTLAVLLVCLLIKLAVRCYKEKAGNQEKS